MEDNMEYCICSNVDCHFNDNTYTHHCCKREDEEAFERCDYRRSIYVPELAELRKKNEELKKEVENLNKVMERKDRWALIAKNIRQGQYNEIEGLRKEVEELKEIKETSEDKLNRLKQAVRHNILLEKEVKELLLLLIEEVEGLKIDMRELDRRITPLVNKWEP